MNKLGFLRKLPMYFGKLYGLTFWYLFGKNYILLLYSDEATEQKRLVRFLQSKGGRLPQIARNVMFQ